MLPLKSWLLQKLSPFSKISRGSISILILDDTFGWNDLQDHNCLFSLFSYSSSWNLSCTYIILINKHLIYALKECWTWSHWCVKCRFKSGLGVVFPTATNSSCCKTKLIWYATWYYINFAGWEHEYINIFFSNLQQFIT